MNDHERKLVSMYMKMNDEGTLDNYLKNCSDEELYGVLVLIKQAVDDVSLGDMVSSYMDDYYQMEMEKQMDCSEANDVLFKYTLKGMNSNSKNIN